MEPASPSRRTPAMALAAITLAHAASAEILLCPAGVDPPQGSLRSIEAFAPGGARLRALLYAAPPPGSPSAAACERVPLAAPAASVAWFGFVPPDFREDPPRTVALQGAFPDGATASVSEVTALRPEPEATESPSAPPTPGDSSITAPRSAWIWSPAAWRDRGEALLALARAHGLRELFLTVPVTGGVLETPAALEAFVVAARAKGVAIWAVVGDARDVLPESRAALEARARAYAAYNASAPAAARLAGLQLDIEPYLLPGFALDPGFWRGRYLETVRAARAAAGALALDLVVPFWWGSHPDFGPRLLEPLAEIRASVTVMNYRTEAGALRAGALPFLAWGARHGRDVRIAVETGPLPDETLRVYGADHPTQGALWLVGLGGRAVAPLMVLLREPVSGLEGKPYSLRREAPFAAANLTFAGDSARLENVVAPLAREWSAWPSFRGLALHGLEDAYFRESP